MDVLAPIKADLEPLSKPLFFGYARWKKESMHRVIEPELPLSVTWSTRLVMSDQLARVNAATNAGKMETALTRKPEPEVYHLIKRSINWLVIPVQFRRFMRKSATYQWVFIC